MDSTTGRRHFLGGILGSLAGALGWRPKQAATGNLAAVRYMGLMTGPCPYGFNPETSLLPPGYPDYTVADLIADYNRDRERVLPSWTKIEFAPLERPPTEPDPFAPFSVSTVEVS